ncbi:hypothetical protein BU26DRAFT_77053 [Trematosphaeria pertusa]|uniref:PD-(D/E)XK nuclease-like domain-containing protein n=1 Tax=Trematosphaeria pertusa TaxID=390896 RepID=A0A6A6I3P0_9PLEO|nr:uncharacterized protein BU26DRAFT_77053 [Trematosphaeria pertusa]KAF2245115.1 hypothetical protein BU26DRAFT_77053 [Trematosphaeria pertusa]
MVAPPSQSKPGPPHNIDSRSSHPVPLHFSPPSMHPISVAAWIRELEPRARARTRPYPSPLRTCKRRQPDSRKSPRPPKKIRRVVLGEMAADDQNMFMPSRKSNTSRPKKSIDKKRMRTPSPSKNQRQFPDDAYSPDDIDDATPRPDRFARSAYPIPDLSYKEALSNEPIEDDDDDDDLQARSPTRSHSHTQSQSSNRSASPKKITSLWNVGNGVIYTHLANRTASKREQLGGNGLALLEKLEDVGDGPVVPAKLKQRLAEADMGKVKQHQFDTSDERPVDELLWELRTIQDIISLSHRCSVNRDHETEWNNRVHTKVLELALGNDETSVRFRSVTAARITPEYRPTHSNNLTTGKIVDYAIHLEPSGPARDIISSLIGMSTDSINHVGYEGLRARPIAISIETKTESRTVEEAKVQLGVWVAAQVARIEALVGQLAPLKVKKPAAEAQRSRLELEMVTRGRRKSRGRGGRMSRAEQLQTQELTPSPTVVMVPDLSDILSQTVFPLIDIQSEAWSLFFARVTPSNAPHLSNSDIRKPVSNIQIFHSVPLGNTANTVQTYRLVKSLKVLRDWVDGDFRKWWDGFLGVRDAEADGG